MSELFELSDTLKAYHRQVYVDASGKRHVESTKAHAAFQKFCQLEQERSIQRVAAELSKSRTLISRWCQRWAWRERVREYDAKMQEAEIAGYIRARRQMSERQSRTAVLGQNIAVTALMELQERLQARGKRRGLTPFECVRLFEVCSKIERICRGGTAADNDQVAAINVKICLQERPRYLDAADAAADPKTEYDS